MYKTKNLNCRRPPCTSHEEFLKPLQLSQKDLAEHIGCDYKVINRIVNEKVSITPEMAIKLAAAFKTTSNFWLNAQMAVDLRHLQSKKSNIRPLIRLRRKKATHSQ